MVKSASEAKLNAYVSTHNGKALDRKKMTAPNEMVKKVMIARFLTLTPAQRQSLKAIVTPQTIDALNVLLPGVVKLMEKQNGAG